MILDLHTYDTSGTWAVVNDAEKKVSSINVAKRENQWVCADFVTVVPVLITPMVNQRV